MNEPTAIPAFASAQALRVWRHPRPVNASGRCIGGRTDEPVDERKARRLAHRIRAMARGEKLAPWVFTSPLQRTRTVGSWLGRWGWRHVISADLAEMDFGAWDGLPWASVPRADIDAWCDDFSDYRPGGGENLRAFLDRVARWQAPAGLTGPVVVVTHGGWMVARRWLDEQRPCPVSAAQWPLAPSYGTCWRFGGIEKPQAVHSSVAENHSNNRDHL